MKAATGELNLTVITLIAISAVIAFFWAFWPTIKNSVAKQWDNINAGGEDKKEGEGWVKPGFIIVDDYLISFGK
jgi:hypothetical protein